MNVYEIVTDKIIKLLEAGVIPWKKPWSGGESAFNRISKKPYSVLNCMLLSHSGEYATYKQWQSLGGQVRKGEESEVVVYWNWVPVKNAEQKEDEEVLMKPVLRYYNVFHISQVDGVEPLPVEAEKNKLEPIDEAERIKDTYLSRESALRLVIEHSDKAYYSPSRDCIVVPKLDQFMDPAEYYSTMFHEMIHSTGHKMRLNRLESGAEAAFGGTEYSKEELVAEIGSAMSLGKAGIETSSTIKNSAGYIQSWLRVLRNDSRFIVSAASKAERAVEYIYTGKREAKEVENRKE